MNKRIKNLIEDMLIVELRQVFEKLNKDQKEMFKKVFGSEIGKFSQEKLCQAIDLCDRTIAKNTKERR